ncbi:MAG: hypothetical protein IPL61_29285 [Myxococcales bacterium]|nr:hypothetical protein [Myxococcales bacterium]
MRTLLLLSTLLAPLALAACGGADAAPAPRTGATPAASAPVDAAALAQCEAFFARARTCTDDYIPALVDVRIELDKPAGIAAEAQQPGGRDGIVAQAKTEWADDSQPAAVTAMCTQVLGSMPTTQYDAMRAQAEACMAASDCAAFSTCSMDMHRGMIGGH